MRIYRHSLPIELQVDQRERYSWHFQIIGQASLSIGVDTGLTHLSAVLNRPTIEIYCDSPVWKTEGYWSEKIINLGDMGKPPPVQVVLQAIDQLI
jgi:heptosyltransferase-1